MNFFEIAYFGINENFFMGIFHGILFSFPLSIPFLIGFRYFIFNGWITGLSSFLGTISGQLLFFVFLCSGTRPLIQFWYTCEPLLTFLGIGLAFQLGTHFYNQRGLGMAGFAMPTLPRHNVIQNLEESTTLSSINHRLAAFSSKIVRYVNEFLAIFSFLKIFLLQFLFIFLNPIFPALSTRIILSQDILIHFSFLYMFGFFVGAITCIFGIIFLGLIGFSFIQLIAEMAEPVFAMHGGANVVSRRLVDGSPRAGQPLFADQQNIASQDFGEESAADFVSNRKYRVKGFRNIFDFFSALSPLRGQVTLFGGAGRTGSSVSLREVGSALRSLFSPQLKTGEAFAINNFFVFCIVGSVLHGSIQYTWRFVTQYPMEFFPVSLWQSLEQDSTKLKPSTSDTWQSLLTREFPTQDSNIRHREKTLPVERHVPIERINARRTLSGRPGLNEEQKSDAYIKYNSFFLNKIEHSFEDLKIKLRENKMALSAWFPDRSTISSSPLAPVLAEPRIVRPAGFNDSTPATYLHFMKNFYLKYFGTLDSQVKPISILQNTSFTILHKNNTKGKPKFSYIRDLYESVALFVSKPSSTGPSPRSGPGLEAKIGRTITNSAKQISVPLNPYIHDDISLYYIYGKSELLETKPPKI